MRGNSLETNVLRYAIGGMLALGALALIFVLFQAMGPGGSSPRALAKGSMAKFSFSASPTRLPDLSFVDAGGTKRTLYDFRGKLVLVNLWATWCGPCKTEMPTLDRLQAELGGPNFEVVAISLDREGPEIAAKFLREAGLEHIAVYNDPTGRITPALQAFALPVTVLVDARSRHLGRVTGPAEWDTPEAKALIRHFMEAPNAPDASS